MRKAWDDKYAPSQHAQPIAELDRAIEKLNIQIQNECK